MRNIVLIFEGLDKTGKTSLKTEILKRTNSIICWDRGPASQWVYGMLMGKEETPSKEALHTLEDCMNIASEFDTIYVWVRTDLDILKKRMKFHNEDEFLIKTVLVTNFLYNSYMSDTQLPIIEINTTNSSIEDCVEKILKEVRDYAGN